MYLQYYRFYDKSVFFHYDRTVIIWSHIPVDTCCTIINGENEEEGKINLWVQCKSLKSTTELLDAVSDLKTLGTIEIIIFKIHEPPAVQKVCYKLYLCICICVFVFVYLCIWQFGISVLMSLDPGLFKNIGFIRDFWHGDDRPTSLVNLEQVCSWNSEQSRLLQFLRGVGLNQSAIVSEN